MFIWKMEQVEGAECKGAQRRREPVGNNFCQLWIVIGGNAKWQLIQDK